MQNVFVNTVWRSLCRVSVQVWMRMIHWHEEDKGLGRMKLANESVSWRGCLYITIPTSTLHATDTTMTTATFHYHFRFLCNWRSLQVRSGPLPQRSLSKKLWRLLVRGVHRPDTLLVIQPKYQSMDSITKLTSCAAAPLYAPAPLLSLWAPTAPDHNVAVGSHGEYVPTVTAAAALCVTPR